VIGYYKFWRSYKRFAFGRRWRATADSATLAHAIHKKRMRKRAMLIMNRVFNGQIPNSVAPLAIDIVNDFTGSGNSLGQRAWPDLTGLPPVFGNFIGEIAHTGGGSYIWTGFSWEPAILGG